MEKKKKLTFFTLGEDIFLRDIIINLRKEYDIKFFQRGAEKEFHQMLHDTDIAWFEFCDQLVMEAVRQPKMCKYLCRLHSYEMFTDLPKHVDWNKIDKLMFVNDVVKDFSIRKFNIRPDIPTLVYNGIDINKFKIPKDKKYNKKVAYVGYINYKKGPELLIQAFKKIWEYDNEFEFHIAGTHQDERIHLYFNNMMQKLPFKVHMDGWVKDMPKYLEDKDFCISTSLFESFQYSIAEGMAQGLFPLVHNWVGSDIFYPTENIFTYLDGCVDIVKAYNEMTDKERNKAREEVRQHIVKKFSLEKQLTEIRKVLKELE